MWPVADMGVERRDVRFAGYSGLMLDASTRSAFDPSETSASAIDPSIREIISVLILDK